MFSLPRKMSFRQIFQLAKKDPIIWYPGHMNKGLRQMQQKLKTIDCIVEVHDARIPISGRNLGFQHTITGSGVKPHILVLNKKDLTDSKDHRDIINELHYGHDKNIIFTNCKQQTCPGIQRILPLATKLISESERYNRSSNKDYNIMIIGVPNVGKSSLINVLRNKHLKKKSAARVGGVAGITRSVGEKIKIQEKPTPIYMVDTPGIMQPRIEDDETGMKLALVGCLPDHIVGEDLIADYLLFWLNKHQRFNYVQALGLPEPCDEISKVLALYAHHAQMFHKVRQYNGQVVVMADLLCAAKKFIQLFRTGQLGFINLDQRLNLRQL